MKRQLLKTAITAALEAGKAILEIYHSGEFAVEIKGDNSPLTKADKASHSIIMSFLTKTKIPVLSEEGGDIPYEERKDWTQLWIVDPLDGTKEFIKRNNEFTVNIALIYNQKPVLGVVYAPATKDLYFAETGLGSYKIENITAYKELNKLKAINLSESKYPQVYTLMVSKSHMNDETQLFVDKKEKEFGKIITISFGSSLKICKVAEGIAHCYPRFAPTMEWDTAAAHAIAILSGQIVVKKNTVSELKYNKKSLLNPHFMVQNEV